MVSKYYNFKLKKLLIYISLLFLCLTSGSVLEGINRMLIFALYIISLIFLYVVFYKEKIFYKIELDKFFVFFIFIFSFYGVFANIIRKDLTVFMFLLRLFFTYSFISFVGYKQFARCFFNIIKIVCIHAIFAFFLQFLFSPENLPFCTWAPAIKTFYGVFNYGARENVLGIQVYRNMGLFTEPGILSVYASIGLLMSYRDNKNKFIFLFTLLSTFSTTGLLVIFVFIIFIIYDKKKLYYLFIIVPISTFLFIYSFANKMDIEKTYSGIQRIADVYFCIKVFFNNWLIGVGFSEDNYIQAFKTIDAPETMKTFVTMLYDRGSSNGALVLFAKGGIIFGLLYFILLINQKIIKENKIKVLVILGICLFGEPLAFTSLFLIFIASAIIPTTHGV